MFTAIATAATSVSPGRTASSFTRGVRRIGGGAWAQTASRLLTRALLSPGPRGLSRRCFAAAATAPGKASALISPDEAEALLEKGGAGVKIIDASWHMPNSGRNGREEHIRGPRLPGAVFFDIDEASDKSSSLPHMMPSSSEFAAYVGGLGIGSADTLVVYDTQGIFSAPRVWWMFRRFGHPDVRVLNGGLPAWEAASKPIESAAVAAGDSRRSGGSFEPRPVQGMVVPIEELDGVLRAKEAAVLDARSAGRFDGTVPDPRGARPGHMPGAANVPFDQLLDEKGRMRPVPELRTVFDKFDLSGGAVTTCGSGVTAAIISLALFECGYRNPSHQRLYDGAWAEWGSDERYPVSAVETQE